MGLHAVSRPVTASYASAVFRAIRSAVSFLHSLNLVHCDVKPENIFLGSEGEIHLGK